MENVKVGAIVRISALKSRPDLNGTFATVLPPENEQESIELETKGRVKVSCFPKALSLKPDNLVLLSESQVHAIDWSFADFYLPGDYEKASLLASIRHKQSRVGHLDACNTFSQAVWDMVGQGVRMPPKELLTKDRQELILNNTAGHHVYILGFDQIGHHIVLETRAGMSRFFQSFLKGSCLEKAGPSGFTGREWVNGKPDAGSNGLPSGMLRARQRWNVPHNLAYNDTKELLKLIFQLQDAAQHIAEELVAQLPEDVKAQEEVYQSKLRDSRSDGRAHHEIGGALLWAKNLNDNPVYVTSIHHSFGVDIISSQHYPGESFHFTLKDGLVKPFMDLYEELTGHSYEGANWIKPLLFKDWRTQGQTHELTQQPEAVGWTFVAATIPH